MRRWHRFFGVFAAVAREPLPGRLQRTESQHEQRNHLVLTLYQAKTAN